MTAQILDGGALAKTMRGEISSDVAQFEQEHGWAPGIAVVQVGGDPASSWYVRMIKKNCKRVSMRFTLHALDEGIEAATLTGLLQELNDDPRTAKASAAASPPDHRVRHA